VSWYSLTLAAVAKASAHGSDSVEGPVGAVKPIRKMDVAFVEGAISTENERRKLKLIRANAGKVIALGSGAINGWPSNLRNDFKGIKKKEVEVLMERLGQIEKVLPVKKVVKVDGEIPGCPVEPKIFIEKMESLL